jgi:hypothetical protein
VSGPRRAFRVNVFVLLCGCANAPALELASVSPEPAPTPAVATSTAPDVSAPVEASADAAAPSLDVATTNREATAPPVAEAAADCEPDVDPGGNVCPVDALGIACLAPDGTGSPRFVVELPSGASEPCDLVTPHCPHGWTCIGTPDVPAAKPVIAVCP